MMLDMGFLPQIRLIITKLPHKRQSLFFSATIPEKVESVMHSFLTDPIRVSVAVRATADSIDQDVVKLAGRAKLQVLHELLAQKEFEKVLVFGRTKFGMNRLADQLANLGFKVAAIHGNKSQGQRQRALQEFKTNRVQVLLATDVASRGLDIDNVTHVINYDLPQSREEYIHRIGRTGRADKTGKALTFVD
jgi:superfamily II DNA/RNA helicase